MTPRSTRTSTRVAALLLALTPATVALAPPATAAAPTDPATAAHPATAASLADPATAETADSPNDTSSGTLSDTSGPTVTLRPRPAFVPGTGIHDGADGDDAAREITLTYAWTQSDPSGICGQSGTVSYLDSREDQVQTLAWTGPRTSITFDAEPTDSLQVTFTTRDCAGRSTDTYRSFMLGKDEESLGSFSREGWQWGHCTCWSGGGIAKGVDPGARAYLDVPGSATVALVSNTGPTRGTADVALDTTRRTALLDAHATAARGLTQAVFPVGSTSGTGDVHVLRVEVVQPRFDVDAVLWLR